LSTEEQNALERAFAGVQPLTGRKRGGPSETVKQANAIARDNETEARARLDALVGKSARIIVERQDEYVTGRRDNIAKPTLRRLAGSTVRPEATLDLHGERATDVPTLVNKFVRMQHKRGLRVLLIIHGKGNHSDGGLAVLGDKVATALSEGGAAPLVAAFSTAHSDHGGTGALVVELVN
jgi:DNA-nicking Smr family endonuclease